MQYPHKILQQPVDDETLQLQRQFAQIETIVKQKMTKEALTRYGTIKAAHPQKAVHIMVALAQNIETIKVITDEVLKQVLTAMEPQRHQTKINMIR